MAALLIAPAASSLITAITGKGVTEAGKNKKTEFFRHNRYF